jgi:hypothetical protein
MALDRLIGIEPVTEVRLPLQAASQKAVSPELYLLRSATDRFTACGWFATKAFFFLQASPMRSRLFRPLPKTISMGVGPRIAAGCGHRQPF